MQAGLRRILLAGLLSALAATWPLPGQAKAADASGWARVPDMHDEHVAHTATLLKDGRVLTAGGADVHGVATASWELFDPKTNRWMRAGNMIHARVAHTATLLADGSVLVTGGQTGLSIFPVEVLASAEIYHPATNAWIAVAAMHVPRRWHNSFRLHDGRVLVIGGTYVAPGARVAAAEQEQAELYDPQRDSWSPAGSGLPPLSQEAANPMSDGSVLVTGGTSDTGFATTRAELFDPTTNRWRPTTWPMATPRYGHTATLLPDGKVLLVGGYTTQQQQTSGGLIYPVNELLTTSEMFDLRGNTFFRVGYSRIPRFEHSATLLRNGTVLVVGSAYASNADSQIIDPKNTEQWASTGLTMDRYLHTATMLADGRVLIAGGYGVGSPTTAWIFSAGISAPSRNPPILLAAGVLLAVLITIGLVATASRLSRRRPQPTGEDDSEWIDS